MTVKLHKGYVGKTREGKRVVALSSDADPEYPWACSDGTFRDTEGFVLDDSRPNNSDIIGPWTERDEVISTLQPYTQEPGEWIGWNGGECPVPPETVVEVYLQCDPDAKYERKAGNFLWTDDGVNTINGYRVIKEHKEPREITLYEDEVGNMATWSGGEMMPVAQDCKITKWREVTE